jgi:hypothetical protein
VLEQPLLDGVLEAPLGDLHPCAETILRPAD